MRQAFILTVAAGFVGVVWTLLRQPAGRVPWMVTAYFVSHAIFVLGIYWASGRAEGNTRDYFETYQVLSAFPLIIACGLAVKYIIQGRTPAFVSSFAIAFAMLAYANQLGWTAKLKLNVHSLPDVVAWNFMLAVGFLTFAVTAFFSLATAEGDIESHLRLALAGFWFCFGAWHFAFAIGKLNPHLGWITRQDWIPTFAIFVCCLWLTYKLSSSQRELSYKALPDIQAIEQRVQEPDYDA